MRLALLVLLAAAAQAQAPVSVQAFSGVDREAVAVGDTVEVTVEVLAVARLAADRRSLADAFAAWDPGAQLGPGFSPVRSALDGSRVTGDVVELRRRVWARVLDPAVSQVPALRLDADLGRQRVAVATRPHRVRAYAPGAALDAAARSVVALTVEGELAGVPFERAGSAFAVGGDALVTAHHVVVGARRVRVRLPDGSEAVVSRAWALDPDRDVAVLHLDAQTAWDAGLRPLVVAPDVSDGAVSFTAGWPGARAGRVQRTTAAPRYADLDLGRQRVRSAANAVAPGDSGGPLLDAAGRALGVVVSGRGETGDPDLLRESVCLAADPGPALARYRAADAPVPLGRALAQAQAAPAGRAHHAVGVVELAAHRPEVDAEAEVGALRDAVRRAGDDPALLFLAGAALDDADDPLAAGVLDAAWRGGSTSAGYALGHHLLARRRLAAAASVFAATARDGAYRRLAALGQAQALMALGRPDDAEAALEPVLDHDARFGPALYLLGLVRLAQGRDADARALVVRLADRPEWADALRQPMEEGARRAPTPARVAAR